MKSLRDAHYAARSLGHAISSQAGQHATVIADAFDTLNERLNALEAIVRAVAQQAGIKVSAADILQATERRQPGRAPSQFETEVRRILGEVG